ncbi:MULTISPECIES: hypothetical protein [unclassified Methylobacterium]|uniref:hypothetical protein n=1 Tax=unclassified Methylobacterium TaxID=2615210 RepID=UPI002269A49E|nr:MULTISPECIES: hypothetical protein [unclassified Methylobacterium]
MNPSLRQEWIDDERGVVPAETPLQRIEPIMAMPEAKGRQGVALLLAIRWDIPSEIVRELLLTAPVDLEPEQATAWAGAVAYHPTASEIRQ